MKAKWAASFLLPVLALVIQVNNLMAQSTPGPLPGLVYVEVLGSDNQLIHSTPGFIVRTGLVAANYHKITGCSSVRVRKAGEKEAFISEGYLSIDEANDWILISVPGLEGDPGKIFMDEFTDERDDFFVIESPLEQKAIFSKAKFKGYRKIGRANLIELASRNARQCTAGPVYYGDKLAGLAVAGYFQDKFFIYLSPLNQLKSLLNRSMIIKPYNSLSEPGLQQSSILNQTLKDSFTKILWIDFEDAIQRADWFNKKILVDVVAPWCGWCKLMDESTYLNQEIVQYVNDNYYAVRLSTESRDTVWFRSSSFVYDPVQKAHQLAYSLLEGNMSFPATVFLDEQISILAVVPGYVNPQKMRVILHYFRENAYREKPVSFEEFERQFMTEP